MKTKDINELGGLYKYMPYTATAYLLCAFSIIGIPPFLGFWPKFMTVLLALNSGHAAAGCLAVVGAVMTLLYLMRLYNKVFLGNERPGSKAEDRNSSMVRVVVILGVLSLISGFMIKPIFDLVRRL